MNRQEIEKAFDKVVRALGKNEDLIGVTKGTILYNKETELLRYDLTELGFYISYIGNNTFLELINHHVYFVHFKDGDGKSISWSDDGRQPKNEKLIKVSFSTGAYCLNGQYDTKTFQEMFEEFKSMAEYEYIDTANKSIYYNLENGAKVYQVFDETLKKYKAISAERTKEDKIKELQKQIEELQ